MNISPRFQLPSLVYSSTRARVHSVQHPSGSLLNFRDTPPTVQQLQVCMPTLCDLMSAWLRSIFNYVTWGRSFVCMCAGAHRGLRRMWDPPETGVTGSCELPDGVLGTKFYPISYLFLTDKPSLLISTLLVPRLFLLSFLYPAVLPASN